MSSDAIYSSVGHDCQHFSIFVERDILTMREAHACDVPSTSDDSCTLERSFICDAYKTTITYVRSDESVFSARDIRVACELDSLDTSVVHILSVDSIR